MSEYEPEDSRNITGTAATKDGRWTGQDGKKVKDESGKKSKAAATKPGPTKAV